MAISCIGASWTRRWGEWASFFRIASSCGGSLKESCRLFFLAAIKRSLVFRGLARHHPEAILQFQVKYGGRRLKVHLRDNGFDICTFVEFFAPHPVMFPYELPPCEPKVLYDIGANIGVASLFFMCKYPRAQIVAFEPVPANHELCRLNLANSPEARAFPWAIAAESGTTTFEFDTADLRGGSIGNLPRAVKGSRVRLDVPLFSVLDLASKRGLPAPDFIKIDVEGAEMDVLRGISDLAKGVKVIIVETHGPTLEKGCREWLMEHAFSVRYAYEAGPGFSTIWASRV